MSEIPATIFDCGVFLQGLMSKAGPAVACLELIEQGRIRLVMSEPVLDEIRDVLIRPSLRELSPNLTYQKVGQLIDLILEKAEFVENVPLHFSFSRDVADEPYLNLAIETNAEFTKVLVRSLSILNYQLSIASGTLPDGRVSAVRDSAGALRGLREKTIDNG